MRFVLEGGVGNWAEGSPRLAALISSTRVLLPTIGLVQSDRAFGRGVIRFWLSKVASCQNETHVDSKLDRLKRYLICWSVEDASVLKLPVLSSFLGSYDISTTERPLKE